MVGKDPHRPQGKTSDAERMASARTKEAPYQAPSASEVAQEDREAMQRRGGSPRVDADEQVGGSRPGVESRVKEAIARRGDEE